MEKENVYTLEWFPMFYNRNPPPLSSTKEKFLVGAEKNKCEKMRMKVFNYLFPLLGWKHLVDADEHGDSCVVWT